jgi:hypothetical protein
VIDRRSFLARALAAGVALYGGKLRVPTEVAPIEEAAAIAAFPPITAELCASGGLCAPVSPYYPLTMVATSRPVRDALPRFSAAT